MSPSLGSRLGSCARGATTGRPMISWTGAGGALVSSSLCHWWTRSVLKRDGNGQTGGRLCGETRWTRGATRTASWAKPTAFPTLAATSARSPLKSPLSDPATDQGLLREYRRLCALFRENCWGRFANQKRRHKRAAHVRMGRMNDKALLPSLEPPLHPSHARLIQLGTDARWGLPVRGAGVGRAADGQRHPGCPH